MYKLYTFALTLVFSLFTISTVFATTYTTTGNNSWSPSTPGKNITSSDDFIINHSVTLYGLNLANGGSVTVNSGGKLKFKWSANFQSGSNVKVNFGGELVIQQVTLTTYSENFVIEGSLTTSGGTMVNYVPGEIYYNAGADWSMNQFTFTNHSKLIMNADADWKNSTVSLQQGGTTEINEEITIKNMTLQNNGDIIGYGHIYEPNGNANFSSNGTINGCQGNSCIPPSTVGKITYLAAPLGGGGTFVPVDGGPLPSSTCNNTVQVLSDLVISSDVKMGSILISPGVTVTIKSDISLEICEAVGNEGVLYLENRASLVQTSSTDENSGSGKFLVERKGSSSSSAYNSWSSPFRNAAIKDMFVGANPCDIFAFDGVSQSWLYDYPVNYQDTCNGNPVTFPSTSVLPGADGFMDVGRGYFAPGTALQTRTITGNVNNGDVTVNIYETSLGHNPLWDDDDWNLVGNPYPCAIDLDAFYEENKDVILGGFYYWVDDNQNGTDYNHSQDYAVFSDGEATAANGATATQYASAGQSFWVYAKHNGTIKFTNDMRVNGNNSDLFKRSDDQNVFVYLDVENDSNNFNQCAVGFNENATNGYDEKSDAPKGEAGSGVYLGSLIDSVPYSIQALEELNEYESVTVSLSMKTNNPGTHTFKVSTFKNVGDVISVYLRDNTTGDLINLKLNNYSLFLGTGDYTGRFDLVFENTGIPAGIEDDVVLNESLFVFQKGSQLQIEIPNFISGNGIDNVVVYDLVGKEVIRSIESGEGLILLDASVLNTGVYVVKTTLLDGTIYSNKIPFAN